MKGNRKRFQNYDVITFMRVFSKCAQYGSGTFSCAMSHIIKINTQLHKQRYGENSDINSRESVHNYMTVPGKMRIFNIAKKKYPAAQAAVW